MNLPQHYTFILNKFLFVLVFVGNISLYWTHLIELQCKQNRSHALVNIPMMAAIIMLPHQLAPAETGAYSTVLVKTRGCTD